MIRRLTDGANSAINDFTSNVIRRSGGRVSGNAEQETAVPRQDPFRINRRGERQNE